MRKTLLISYYFPPMGMAGIGRPLNLFKRLPEFGYDCEVLTVKPVAYWAHEPELLDALDNTKIHRAGSRDPQRIMYLLGMRRIRASFAGATRRTADRFFPDSKIGWVKPAVRLGRTLMENHRYDIIISTSPPVSSHLVGKRLADEFKVPWVADFRDFWTVEKIEDAYSDTKMIERGRRLLDRIQSKASAITVVDRSIGEYWHSDNVIPNGYDVDLAQGWKSPPDKAHFYIGLPGNLLKDRVVEPLFEVLNRLRQEHAQEFAPVRLVQVGAVDTAWLQAALARYGLDGICEINGYVPRSDVVRRLSRCSLHYLGFAKSSDPNQMPSRVFELLAGGRPILVYGSAGNAVEDALRQSGNGFCFGESDLDGAVSFIRDLVTRFRNGDLTVNPLPESAVKYSSRSLAQQFAKVLDRL